MWPFNKTKQVADPEPVPEKKALGDDPLDFTILAGGMPTGFGVSGATALTVPAVQAAIRVISEAAATLDVTVKRRAGAQEVDAPDHPAAKLLTGEANPWTSGYELIRDLVAQALTHDAGGLAWVNRIGGKPMEIIRYDPGAITVEYATTGTGEPTYRLFGKRIAARDVIHVRGPFSRCPLSLARDAIGMAKELERHGGNLFKNGARPGGVIETPKPIGDEGVKKMLTGWRAAHEGSNAAGRTALLWDGAQFKAQALNSTDAQYLENRKFQIDEIARAFRIPPSMIYSLDRMTWSNWESAGRDFIVYALMPWLRALESAFNRALLTDEERGTYRICFDVDDTTQADLTARSTAISTLISAQVLNSNEARDWLGMPPRDGGDVYANPAINPTNDNKPPEKEEAA